MPRGAGGRAWTQMMGKAVPVRAGYTETNAGFFLSTVLLTQHWPKNMKFKKTLVHQIKRNINKVVSVFTLESPEGEKCRREPDR